jgi:hypothetical protein
MHQCVLIELVISVAVVTIFEFTPHHSYYCRGFTLWWVFASGSTVINMYPLVFGLMMLS